MKNIDKLIRHYILEIVIVLLFVGISYPFWQVLNKSGIAKIANSYHTMDYLYLDVSQYISDSDFEDMVAIVNDTNTTREYTLVLKIERDKVNNDAQISLNDEIFLLDSLKYQEDGIYNYYELGKGYLVAGKNDYKISFVNAKISYEDVQYDIIENHEI